jgi:DNA-directed RNA polymerase subunit K/omega
MIYPSVNELLKNCEINRYELVTATSKCARIITDEYVKQREYAEKLTRGKDSADKKVNLSGMIKREYRDDKAVKTAINGLYGGEFKIIEPDGKVVMLGGHKPDENRAEEDAANEAENEHELNEDLVM